MTCIVYGSTMGNTEGAAGIIADKIDGETKVISVSNLTADTIKDSDVVLLGSSTWGIGDLQDDWDMKIDELKNYDFSGKKVGFFGCGDQEGYPDSFVDALGTLYNAVKDSAGEIIGKWPTEGYTFDGSTAVIDGMFVGVALDDDNQPNLTEKRIEDWVKSF